MLQLVAVSTTSINDDHGFKIIFSVSREQKKVNNHNLLIRVTKFTAVKCPKYRQKLLF